MKKKLLLAPLMAVLVACVVLLSGCGGPSVEELITKDLTTQFDEVKNGGDDFLAGLEEASGDEFEQLGIDPKEYAKSYLEGFDYKIGDVTVDEDKGTATAEVTITCKSMNQIVEDFATQYQEKVAALDSMPSDDELYKMAGQVMVDVTKAAKTKDTKVTFKYSCNDDGEWSADDSATRQLVIQRGRHDQKVYAVLFSCQFVRSGARSLSVLYLRRCHGSHWGRQLGTFLFCRQLGTLLWCI